VSLLLPTAWAQQPKPGGTLLVAWEADVTGLDPHLSPGIQAYFVVGNLFNSLLTIDAELNYVPELAESWDVLEDGKVYVFHLRKGVKFHDGTDFDAEVVRWNFQRIVDPEEKAIDVPFYSIVEAVEVVDTYTVKFTLKHPSATLLAVMAANRAGFLQMSPASYKQWGKENVRLHPVGTGPFKLVRWDQNQIIVLEKNPPLLQARAPLSGSHRVAHHEGGGHTGDGVAGGGGRLRQCGAPRARGPSDARHEDPVAQGPGDSTAFHPVQPAAPGL
jgi:ABC-type transport system substrate-binding protein